MAWTNPSPETIKGEFDGRTFSHNGADTRFYQKDGAYIIETEDTPGEKRDYDVVGVAGIAPLQQYIVETEPGRLQSFDVVWDVLGKRWYHLYPDQDLTPEDGLHWTGPYKNWNARCAECHATGFRKNYDPARRRYQSTQAEIGVGCEACHGPGQVHVAWAETGVLPDSAEPGITTDLGLLIDYGGGPATDGKSPAETQIQQCAGCHSRREPFADGNPLPGTAYHDAYRLSTLRTGLYHPDGQIRDEVYVYGSFLQSKMYAKGVTCTNCHDPHRAEVKFEGNQLCTQCHSPAGNPDFPSLPLKIYDEPSHTYHTEGSAGSDCKSCHMIERVYMGTDGRRDHSFRIPRPDLSVQTGAPNACNDCHGDKSAEWAADKVAVWHPDSSARQPHFSQTMAAGRADPRGQADALIGLAEYDALPAIVRASALDLLQPLANSVLAARLAPLLSASDPLLRTAAIGVQRGASEAERRTRLGPMLADPVKAVRIAAARELIGTPMSNAPDQVMRALDRAIGEWQASLVAKADFPEAQMAIAGVALVTRRLDFALSAFSEAVRQDPQLVQAWVMLVRIHLALGNRTAAMDAVQEALTQNPGDATLTGLRAQFAPSDQ